MSGPNTSSMSDEEQGLWSDINNPNNEADMDDWADANNPDNDHFWATTPSVAIGVSLSANIVDTPATLGISGGRWR